MDDDLWSACERAADTAARTNVADLTATDLWGLLQVLLESLHTLLSPNAVCLDMRRTR